MADLLTEDIEYRLYCGNAFDVLKTFPSESVDCCVTSPPYFGLRDYGTATWVGGDPNCPHFRQSKFNADCSTGHKAQGDSSSAVGDSIYKSVCPLCGAVRVDEQIGLEETPEEYVSRLVEVFHEVKRVLKNDGTLWLNLGDSYWSSAEGKSEIYKSKDLIGIPWMVAFALRNDGWYLRQDIVWCLSGGIYLYVKSQKGIRPMMIKDLIRLDPKTVQLWNGEKWVSVNGYAESNDNSSHLELVLRSGERIGTTGNHRWILKDGTEVLAKNLKVGDVLKTTRLPELCTHHPRILTENILWLIGLYIAEGSHSDDTIQISLCADEVHWVEKIRSAVEEVGGTITYDVHGNNLSVRIYSKIFNAVLSQYVSGKTAKDKHLSDCCWNMPNSALRKIVDGYLDGDGSFDEGNNRIRIGFTRNYYLERDLRILAARLDAVITLIPTFSKIGNKRYPTFHGEWRWERTNHHNEKDRSEIVEIRKSRARHFYDISVDCENHLFALASGVLTHNCKTNSMPESVKDRCTRSHEYIFLLSKSEKYRFDYESIMEDATTEPTVRDKHAEGYQADYAKGQRFSPGAREYGKDGKRNKRDVWTVPVSGGFTDENGAHYATFSEKLIKPCITAGCRAGGIVLDPFSGTGTTGVTALKLGRRYVGIDLSEKYIDMAHKRLKSIADQENMFDLMLGEERKEE